MTSRKVRVFLTAALIAAVSLASWGDDTRGKAIAVTPTFAFHSDFETNLHDALVVAGSARRGKKPELFRSATEDACFAKLAPSARKGWDLAVDYFAEIVSPANWADRQQLLIRFELAGIEASEDERTREYLAVTRGVLAAAAPAYEQCRWATQDAANRAWMADLAPRLEKHETTVTKRLERLYATPWHGLPIRVDIVAKAPPLGANTWIVDPGGHILISTTIEGNVSLETVFHEATHTLAAVWRPDPLPKALSEASKALDVPVPRDLWHVVLFYTTGQVVREALDAAGEPGYTPMVESLWSGSWAPLRGPIVKVWPSYLAGERTLDEAAAALVQAIGEEAAKGAAPATD